MFWSKKEKVSGEEMAEKVATEAEGLYRSGKMHCAEAVLAALKNNFGPHIPEEAVAAAAGFGGGSQAGCICGAVSGGTIAMGLVLKDDRKRVMSLTKELHEWFTSQFGVNCCRVLRGEKKEKCPELTAKTAGKVAQLLLP